MYRNPCNLVTLREPGGVTKGGLEKGVFVTGVPGGSENASRYKVTNKSPTPLYSFHIAGGWVR